MSLLYSKDALLPIDHVFLHLQYPLDLGGHFGHAHVGVLADTSING